MAQQQQKKNNNQAANRQQQAKPQQQSQQKQFQQAQAKLLSAIPNLGSSKEQQKQLNDFMAEGTRAVEEAIAASTEEAKKIQEKILELSRESAENIAKSADSAVKGFNEAVEMGKDNFEAIVESTNIASKISKAISTEVSEFANDKIAENFRAFEEFLSCKTASDFFNLQSNLFRSNLDAAFNESLKLTELFMQYGKAIEPVGERVTVATEKLAKNIAA